MIVNSKIIYKTEFNQRELKMIRRALELEGSKYAAELCRKISEDIRSAQKELSKQIDVILEVECEKMPE